MEYKKKPLLRGIIHLLAFRFVLICAIEYILRIKDEFKIGMFIYILSQLLLYGVSSTYHLNDWKTDEIEKFMRKLDHSSIFILIASTQTSIVLKIFNEKFYFLLTTWLITILGIIKELFIDVYNFINVFIYIFHGISIIPFINVNKEAMKYSIFYISGGIFYSVGGFVYALKRPDIFPNIFGFHELFHLFTVFGNTCFFIPIMLLYNK